MKRDVILAGVGGQGLLTIAAAIAGAAHALGLQLKQSEVHGMAQRGGVVRSHVRLSDCAIHSDLIPEGAADLLLAAEPMEALRYLPYLGSEGMVVANAVPLKNIGTYPNEDRIASALDALPRRLVFDAAELAREAGSIRSANIVLLGAGTPFLGMPVDALREAVDRLFASKGNAVVETNRRAFDLGLAEGQRAAS